MLAFGIVLNAPFDLTRLYGLPYAISETGTVIVFVAVALIEFYLRASGAFALSPNWPALCARAIGMFLKRLLKK
jgi:hypothetical protein